MEKLEDEVLLSGTEGGSVDPEMKMGHWSARLKTTVEGSEVLTGAENEKQGSNMEVDEATLQKASVEVQSRKRKVIRVESEENARLRAGGRLRQSVRKKQMCQVPQVNREGLLWV